MNFNILSIILTLLVFSVLVTVHEWGHFIVAKKSGILVQEFSIGMGPVLWSRQKGETKYSLRAFPIGGFCSMYGEEGESINPRAFNSKNVWVRIAVIFAGPLMNFIFAFLLVFGLSATAAAMILPVVDGVIENTSAEAAGLQNGDRIIKVDGYNIHTYEDLRMSLENNSGENIDVTVKRGNKKVDMNIEPAVSDETGKRIIGIYVKIKTGLFAERHEGFEHMSLIETAHDSLFTMVYYVKAVVIGLVRMFSLNFSLNEVAGPIGIVEVVGESVENGMEYSVSSAVKNVINFAALLSTNLGAINLFPIPAVDGGRLAFLFLEVIRRKPIPQDKEGFIHFIGFVLLMGFTVFIAFNDVARLFGR